MLNNVKIRLMCALTAASVALGSMSMPVNVWAYDDDDFLDDLDDLDDDEIEFLRLISDYDDDDDVDEDDVDAIATLIAIAELEEEEAEYRKKMEREEEERRRNARVCGIWVSTTDMVLTTGQTYQITAGVKPDSAVNRGISFSSSDPSCASVDGSGIVRGNSVGSCVITATTNENGYQAHTYVRVNPAPAAAAQTKAEDANWTALATDMIVSSVPGTVLNLSAPKAISFDANMINALISRPDVGLSITYPYNGHVYLMKVPAGYNLASKMDAKGKVSFLSLAGVKDGRLTVTMVK
ncbi:MAG: Ig-like domain-containing protein [Lachnospiraceae bacterium]|nr:Ig-like domain-containing protein [Lachnospiraceae bacterium]